MRKIDEHFQNWLHKFKVDGLLSWYSDEGSLRYAANTAFLALIALD